MSAEHAEVTGNAQGIRETLDEFERELQQEARLRKVTQGSGQAAMDLTSGEAYRPHDDNRKPKFKQWTNGGGSFSGDPF